MKCKTILLLILLQTAGALGQINIPGTTNVVTTPFSVDWLLNTAAADGLADLGIHSFWTGPLAEPNWAAYAVDANNAEYNVRHYGVTGDGVTDDTAALQALVDAVSASALAYGEISFPPGTYMVSNLLLPAPCHLEGLAMGQPILKMIAGSTGNMIEDAGNAQKAIICNLQIHGNDCDANGIVLGYGAHQHGGGAHLDNLWIRGFKHDGIRVNGNACFYTRIDLSGGVGNECKGVFTGAGNQYSQLLQTGYADYGLELTTLNSTYLGIHCEGEYSSAAVLVDGDQNYLNGVNVTVDGSATLPAAIEFAAGEYGNMVDGLLIYAEAGGTITSAIIDNHYSTGRTIIGEQGPTGNYRWVTHYAATRQPNVSWGVSDGPPTEGENWKGDIAWTREGSYGEPAGWKCTTQGTPGTWAPFGLAPGSLAKTTDYTMIATDSGKRCSNDGAVDGDGDPNTITVTLLHAVVGAVSAWAVLDANDIILDPLGTDRFRGRTNGQYLRLDDQGAAIEFYCRDGAIWDIRSAYDPNISDHEVFKWE